MKILESVLKSWNKHARLILSVYLLHTQPFHSQVLINDSSYCLPYNSIFFFPREFGIGSTYFPLIDFCLYYRHLSV